MSKAVKKVVSVATLGLSDSILGGADAPSVAPTVQAPDTTPTPVGEETSAAREAQRRRQLAAAGLGGNTLTGASGLSSAATTAGKSLLGS